METHSFAPARSIAPWLVAAAALLVAGWSLGLPFLAEDHAWVSRAHERAQEHGFWGALLASVVATDGPGFYRPVFQLVMTLDHALWGLDPLGYHVTNVLLLVSASLLVRSIALRMLGRGPAAEVAALLFVASPLLGDSAFLVAGCDTLLPVVLTLSAVRFALSERRAVRAIGVPVAGTLACFAKEWALLVVPVAVVLTRASAPGDERGRVRRVWSAAVEAWPLAVGCAAYVVIRAALLGRWVGGYRAKLVPPDALEQRFEQIAALLFPVPTSAVGEVLGWIAPAVVLVALVTGLRTAAPLVRRCVFVAVGWILAVNLAHLPVRIGRPELGDVRYAFPAVPPLCLLLAAAWSGQGPRVRRVALACWLVACLASLAASIADWRAAGRAMRDLRAGIARAVEGSDVEAVEVIGVPSLIGSARFGFGVQAAFDPPFARAGAVPVQVTSDLSVPHRGLRRSPEVLGLWRWAFGEPSAGGLRLLWDRRRSTLGVPFPDASPELVADAWESGPHIEVVESHGSAQLVLRGSPRAAFLLFAGPECSPRALGTLGMACVACASPVGSDLLDDRGRAEFDVSDALPEDLAIQAVFLTDDGRVEFSRRLTW